jgi:SPX domain protein involved in polyphosphate accumulation
MIAAWLPDPTAPMQTALPNLRYERKFVAEGANSAEVLARVRCHPGAFREVYPPRVVNNVYLDSPARRDYHDHINGAANRTKTRVRWYGPQFDSVERPTLERKLKRGLVSGKTGHALPKFTINAACLGSFLTRNFDAADLPQELRLALRHMEPVLLNRYRRHYFLSRDGNFRLTVDSELQFAGVQPDGRPRTFSGAASAVVVIELKFAPELAEKACLVANRLPFRVSRGCRE